MPQLPVETTLFVSKVTAGPGIVLDPTSGTGIVGISSGVGPSAALPQQAYNTEAGAPASGTLDLTAADISGGSVKVVLNLTDAAAAASNAKLPTVAALVAALEALGITPQAGSSYELDIINGANTDDWTVTTNTGWTLDGTMTIAENYLRKFIVSFQSLTAATLQSIGTFEYNPL